MVARQKPPKSGSIGDDDDDDDFARMERRRQREEEIIAMGGDPFFLMDDEPEEEEEKDDNDVSLPPISLLSAMASMPSAVEIAEKVKPKFPDGTGPRPKEEEDVNVADWDGWEIEGAHFDE